MLRFMPSQGLTGWFGIFLVLLSCLSLSCSKQGAVNASASQEARKNSPRPQNVDYSQIADHSQPAEKLGGMPPDWERKLGAEILTVASEAQIMEIGRAHV